jgi:hypothetical protein
MRNSWPPGLPGNHPCNDGQRSARTRGVGSQQHRSGDCMAASVRIGGLQGRSGAAASYMIVSRLAGCVAVRAVQATRLAHQQKMCGGPSPSLAYCTESHAIGEEPRARTRVQPSTSSDRRVHTHTQAAKRIRPRSLSTAQLTPRRAVAVDLGYHIDFACIIAVQRLTCSSKRYVCVAITGWGQAAGQTTTTRRQQTHLVPPPTCLPRRRACRSWRRR